jgi:hypothetical protein
MCCGSIMRPLLPLAQRENFVPKLKPGWIMRRGKWNVPAWPASLPPREILECECEGVGALISMTALTGPLAIRLRGGPRTTSVSSHVLSAPLFKLCARHGWLAAGRTTMSWKGTGVAEPGWCTLGLGLGLFCDNQGSASERV